MTRTQTNPDLEVVVRNWIIMLPPPRTSLPYCSRAMDVSVAKRRALPAPLLFVSSNSPTPRL